MYWKILKIFGHLQIPVAILLAGFCAAILFHEAAKTDSMEYYMTPGSQTEKQITSNTKQMTQKLTDDEIIGRDPNQDPHAP